MTNRRDTVALLSGVIVIAMFMSVVPHATLRTHPTTVAAPPAHTLAHVPPVHGRLPLSFEANEGQTDPQVRFLTRGRGHQLFLTPKEAVLTWSSSEARSERQENFPQAASQSAVRMRFEGADPHAEGVGLDRLPGIVNYFIGSDSSKWRTNIPTYQKVEYKDVYPGIDLVYYGNQGQLEYDLIVAPGADPAQITMAFEGAQQIALDEHGDLVLTVTRSPTDAAGRGAAELRGGPITSTDCCDAFVTKINAAGTTILYSTYLGGDGVDGGLGIAVDRSGNAYVTGSTTTPGSGFPGTAGSLIQSTFGGGIRQPVPKSGDRRDCRDAFVTKINAAGTAILYSTYLGGSGFDEGLGIAVDQIGNAYVVGTTNTQGSDFPGTAASDIQSINAGGGDAFIAKVDAAGTAILYSTYLGGNGDDDTGNGIAVDAAGNAYVTGNTNTQGSGFPGTAGSLIQNTHAGGIHDAFVAKIATLTLAGTSGTPNCHGRSVSALARQFGGMDAAASALGFQSVQALQDAIRAFCGN